MNLTAVVTGGIFGGIFLLICIYSAYKAVKDRKRIIAKNARIRGERLKEQLEEEERCKKQNGEQNPEDPGYVHDIVQYSTDMGIEFSNEVKVPNGKPRSASSDDSCDNLDKLNGHNVSVTTATIEATNAGSRANLLDGSEPSENDSGISRGDSNKRRRSSKFKKSKSGSPLDEKSPEYDGRVNPSLTPDETVDIAMETAVSPGNSDILMSREAQTDITAVKKALNLRNQRTTNTAVMTSSTGTSTEHDTNNEINLITDVGLVEREIVENKQNATDAGNERESIAVQNNETAAFKPRYGKRENHLSGDVIHNANNGNEARTQTVGGAELKGSDSNEGDTNWGTKNTPHRMDDYENGNIQNGKSAANANLDITHHWDAEKKRRVGSDSGIIGKVRANGVSMGTSSKSASIEEIVVNI